jgi:hypothetical protein
MPRISLRNQLLDELDKAELALAIFRYKHALQIANLSDSDSNSNSDDDLDADMLFTPSSPLTPLFSDISDSDLDLDSFDELNCFAEHYDHIHDTITSLYDEVLRARVLQRPDALPM